MAGVNLNEESARILATNSELVGTQIRSCKDEAFLHPGLLHRRILETGEKVCLHCRAEELCRSISFLNVVGCGWRMLPPHKSSGYLSSGKFLYVVLMHPHPFSLNNKPRAERPGCSSDEIRICCLLCWEHVVSVFIVSSLKTVLIFSPTVVQAEPFLVWPRFKFDTLNNSFISFNEFFSGCLNSLDRRHRHKYFMGLSFEGCLSDCPLD